MGRQICTASTRLYIHNNEINIIKKKLIDKKAKINLKVLLNIERLLTTQNMYSLKAVLCNESDFTIILKFDEVINIFGTS